MTERKPPNPHPSTAISTETVEEIAYRVFLLRLEPPLTPKESAAKVRHTSDGRVKASDEIRRRNSKCMLPLVRDALRVLVDMEMVKP
jgi:hypothetical protein